MTKGGQSSNWTGSLRFSPLFIYFLPHSQLIDFIITTRPCVPKKKEKGKINKSAVRDAYATVTQARLGVSIGVQ